MLPQLAQLRGIKRQIVERLRDPVLGHGDSRTSYPTGSGGSPIDWLRVLTGENLSRGGCFKPQSAAIRAPATLLGPVGHLQIGYSFSELRMRLGEAYEGTVPRDQLTALTPVCVTRGAHPQAAQTGPQLVIAGSLRLTADESQEIASPSAISGAVRLSATSQLTMLFEVTSSSSVGSIVQSLPRPMPPAMHLGKHSLPWLLSASDYVDAQLDATLGMSEATAMALQAPLRP
jgi:hypothetical protein